MVYENIIIGSGLTALGVGLGLPKCSNTLVITGGKHPTVSYYNADESAPSNLMGFGGLGNYWHGVIPMEQGKLCWGSSDLAAELFGFFYPTEAIKTEFGASTLFVPRNPIRTKRHWERLVSDSSSGFQLVHDVAKTVRRIGAEWEVAVGGQSVRAHRIWIAAGALGTSALLERSPELKQSVRRTLSDHLILYMGQVDCSRNKIDFAPQVRLSKHGYWLNTCKQFGDSGLIVTKPARFSFKTVDKGIEHRDTFGLPTSGVLSKVVKAGSLGLISEALFNKYGLFPNSKFVSVYAQIRVENGYARVVGTHNLVPDYERIQESIRIYRQNFDHPSLVRSQRTELYVNGIHLHGSVDCGVLNKLGVNTESSTCQVVDPSVYEDVGDLHHSFRLMSKAYEKAKRSSA